METKGYVKITLFYEGKQIVKRVVKILNEVVRKLKTPIEKIKGGYLENAEGNNTILNNTLLNNTIKERDKEILFLKLELKKAKENILLLESNQGKEKKLSKLQEKVDSVEEVGNA